MRREIAAAILERHSFYKRKKNIKIQRCVKCGYRWKSRIDLPKECPNCKSRWWKANKK